jgi:hypothetical protein
MTDAATTCEERDCTAPAVTSHELHAGDVVATFELCQAHADRLDGDETPELQPGADGELVLILDHSPAE